MVGLDSMLGWLLLGEILLLFHRISCIPKVDYGKQNRYFRDMGYLALVPHCQGLQDNIQSPILGHALQFGLEFRGLHRLE